MRFAQEIGQIYYKIEQKIFLTLKVNAQKCAVNFKQKTIKTIKTFLVIQLYFVP